jgi:four helix bundle protein
MHKLDIVLEKRKYPKAFTSKVLDTEGEVAETQKWLDFAKSCGYMGETDYENIYQKYDNIIGKLVNIRRSPEKWSR